MTDYQGFRTKHNFRTVVPYSFLSAHASSSSAFSFLSFFKVGRFFCPPHGSSSRCPSGESTPNFPHRQDSRLMQKLLIIKITRTLYKWQHEKGHCNIRSLQRCIMRGYLLPIFDPCTREEYQFYVAATGLWWRPGCTRLRPTAARPLQFCDTD